MKYDQIEDAGATFGRQLARQFSRLRTTSVTVASVDKEAGVANVFIYEDTNTFPVPLSFLPLDSGSITVIPVVGSQAAIAFLDSNLNTPIFVGMSAIAYIEIISGDVSATLDAENDTINFTTSEASINVSGSTITFNGGDLGGLVEVGRLTKALNSLCAQINQIQANIATHSHPVSTNSGSGSTTGTIFTQIKVQDFSDDDYENKNVLQ